MPCKDQPNKGLKSSSWLTLVQQSVHSLSNVFVVFIIFLIYIYTYILCIQLYYYKLMDLLEYVHGKQSLRLIFVLSFASQPLSIAHLFSFVASTSDILNPPYFCLPLCLWFLLIFASLILPPSLSMVLPYFCLPLCLWFCLISASLFAYGSTCFCS